MALNDFLIHLRDLHKKAKVGQLDTSGRGEYDRDRDELAQALLTAQRLQLTPGMAARRTLRVPKALQVEFEVAGARVKSITVEISGGGFSAVLGEGQPVGSEVGFSLRVPGGDTLQGRANVSDVKRQAYNHRVGFAIKDLKEPDRDRLELIVFDEVLQKLGAG